MISCNVIATGTISSSAMLRKTSDGANFSTFEMKVNLTDKSGNPYIVGLSVSCDPIEDPLSYREGTRISLSGTMRIKKVDDNTYLNVKAASLSLSCPATDSISCDLSFKGKIGKSVNKKEDKKGRPFYSFSAYSSDTYGENRTFIWIDFLYFGEAPGDWFSPGTYINANGPLEFSVFKDKIKMSCVVKSIDRWELSSKS